MSTIRHLWAHHRIAFIAFFGGGLIALFFLVRLAAFSVYWANPAHRNRAPEPWMTPGYIAHSWNLPPTTLTTALGIAPGSRPTLADIARERGVPVADIIKEINVLLESEANQ